MMIQKLRLQRGWSQQQLAEMSGLSTRTIQRLENGNSASIESLKSLAAVFEVDFSILQGEIPVFHRNFPTFFAADQASCRKYSGPAPHSGHL